MEGFFRCTNLFMVSLFLFCCLFKVLMTDNVVPVKNVLGLVPSDRHGNALGNSEPHHVPYCCPSEIVVDLA
jgi:hypothetical protein